MTRFTPDIITREMQRRGLSIDASRGLTKEPLRVPEIKIPAKYRDRCLIETQPMMPSAAEINDALSQELLVYGYGVNTGRMSSTTAVPSGPVTPDLYERIKDMAVSMPVWDNPPRREHRHHTIGSTGYSAMSSDRSTIRKVIKTLARDLPMLMREYEADCVVVRGTSGTSVAFHLWMETDFPIIVARKRGEKSHDGLMSKIGPGYHEARRWLFLDDFVSSGETLRLLCDDMMPAEHVGTLAYRRAECGSLEREYEDRQGKPYWKYVL